MNRSDLIPIIKQKVSAEHPDITIRDIRVAIPLILEFLSDCLAEGQRVDVREFGAFFTTDLPAKQGRNPRTGEPVDLPVRRMPRFRAALKIRKGVGPE